MSRVEIIGRWTCEQCGLRFDRDKSGARPIRFCGSACYHQWRAASGATAGQFASGLTPWNKGLKGLHLSPQTEYRPGRVSEKWVPVGTISIRRAKRERHDRAWVKVAEPNVWKLRAVMVWEAENGPVPAGSVIHHKDRHALNDVIGNLDCLTRAEHIAEHRHELRRLFADERAVTPAAQTSMQFREAKLSEGID